MPYAIIRVEKVKSLGSLSGLSRHHMRTAQTPNADPNAPETIRVLVGNANPFQDVKARLPEKVRKNGVLAMEHLLTASPEYFRPNNPSAAGTYDKKRMEEWAARATKFLQERYGDNLASAVLHLDEATPHIHSLVVPKRRGDGKLDAAKLFGPEQLRSLQDDYAAAMKPLGLERGIEGSRAKHERVKAHYGRVNAPTPPIPAVKTPQPEELAERNFMERIPFTDAKIAYDEAEAKTRTQSEKRRKEISERRDAMARAWATVAAKASVVDQRKKADMSREKALEKMRSEAARVREIPLSEVMERLGCERHKKDKHNWETPAGRITVTGSKFFNHDLNVGGGGAIDLVKQQLACDYKSAVAWLGGEIGKEAAIGAAMAAAKVEAVEAVAVKPPSPVPTPSLEPAHVERVKRYLVEQRKLDAGIVDALITQGVLYACSYSPKPGSVFVNAAFKLKSGGVELRGTSGNYHGVRGKKDIFQVQRGGEPKKTVFVESSIDALSYLQLHPAGELKVISTAGSSSEKLAASVKEEAAAGRLIVAGFDADNVGRQLSEVVKFNAGKSFEGREFPGLDCKDWNEEVQLRADPVKLKERLVSKELDGPSFEP